MTIPKPITGDLVLLLEEFQEHLVAAGNSPHTIKQYVGVVRRFGQFRAGQDLATDVAALTRRDVQAFLRTTMKVGVPIHLASHNGLCSFFRFLIESGEITAAANPMEGIRRPKTKPMSPVSLLPPDAAQRMVGVVQAQSPSFWTLRDEALVRVFWDTPGRVSEISSISIPNIDLVGRCVQVLGKGSKWRTMRFQRSTAKSLHRYMTARQAQWKEPWGDALWIGQCRGPALRPCLTASGVRLILQRIAREAGLGDIHPHQFRHTFADRWLESGGGEIDLVSLGGWSGPRMLMIYGRAGAERRALGAYDRILG